MIMRKHVDHIFCNPDSQKVKVKLYLGQFEIKNISILHMNIYIYMAVCYLVAPRLNIRPPLENLPGSP